MYNSEVFVFALSVYFWGDAVFIVGNSVNVNKPSCMDSYMDIIYFISQEWIYKNEIDEVKDGLRIQYLYFFKF